MDQWMWRLQIGEILKMDNEVHFLGLYCDFFDVRDLLTYMNFVN